MVKKMLIAAGLVLCLGAAGMSGSAPARAQTGSLPPTIISFAADLDTITLAEAEAGETSARLAWQVVGLTGQERLVLESFQVRSWLPLAPDRTEPLTASGDLELLVMHPLNFGPPTYRLRILSGAQNTVLDERVVTIPYDAEAITAEPEIVRAETVQTTVDSAALASGTARIPVSWEMLNRPPETNLVFEQVLEGGRIVPVELPRPNLWIPSAGEGVVAPVLPGSGQPVRLQVRLVNMADGATLAQAALAPVTVTAAAQPVPPAGVPAVPTSVPGQPGVRIDFFAAAPDVIERGASVTLSWQVTGASRVSVWRLEPGGPVAEESPVTSPVGTWTVTVPGSYVDYASFMLNAVDATGALLAQRSVSVTIVCPYVYFFNDPGTQTCPQGPAATVQAAYQPFEGGFMLWRADNSQIMVFYNNAQVRRYSDTWTGGEVTVPETPPAGLFQPVRGFGNLWATMPEVRNPLGWATALEQGYTMQYQQTGEFKYPRTFMTLPDGRIIYVQETMWGYR